jgi:hypothetical protein
MLQMTLHLTRSSRLWTLLLLLGFEVPIFTPLTKKPLRSNGDTQRRDFRLLEDKIILFVRVLRNVQIYH